MMRGKLLGLAKNRKTFSMPPVPTARSERGGPFQKAVAGVKDRPSERKADAFLTAGVDFHNGSHFTHDA
jgi:hypothetical protein